MHVAIQRRVDDQLRQAHKMEANAGLMGGVAHDSNKVLSIINTFTEFLHDRIDPPMNCRFMLRTSRKQLESTGHPFRCGCVTLKLVQSLLEFPEIDGCAGFSEVRI